MQPKIYTSADHHIRNNLVDKNALTVLRVLHEAGHIAYLVGGGVRDLLLRKEPKDFDISTSARPEEVKKLFRSCILIGRRFRLAHVRFGREVVEVATFRAGDPTEGELIVQDNVWGTPEEDVMRRDFTINGLFYDPLDHKIIDYVGGFEDLQKHLLRVIGTPEVRFKQDPVRMIRMLKFRARFGFHVEEQAHEVLQTCKKEIKNSSPARVLEEVFRMLESGASEPFFRLLQETDFLSLLFPGIANYFAQEMSESIYAHLKAADSMNTKGRYRTLERSVLAAALLFPIYEHEIKLRYLAQEKIPHLGDLMDLAHTLVHDLFFDAFSHFPRKIRLDAHSILHMQYRLSPLDQKRRPRTKLIHQKGFRRALVFLKLRALLHPKLFKNYEHWKRIYQKEHAETST
ncbi:MAG: Poly(A) polymerase I [Chlamydiae bacterium]|nr:Poly(A) polymerase I [Chlamydiota bacterium]